MFERFAGDAFRSVRYAVEEARAMGAAAVDQEHLLIGLLRARSTPAAQALGAVGLSLEESRERAERLGEDALASLGISLEDVRERTGIDLSLSAGGVKRLPVSRAAKRALNDSLSEAKQRGDRRIGTEHVLLALIHDSRGNAARLLAALAVAPRAVEERLESTTAGTK